MKSCVCLENNKHGFFKGGVAVWWKKERNWKCDEWISKVENAWPACFFFQVTLFDTLQEKKYVQNTSYNTQILRAFRFFWWKNVGVSLSKKHSLKDSTNVLMQ